MSLARTHSLHEVGEDAAIAHGLKKCGICWRTAKAKNDGAGWMKEGK